MVMLCEAANQRIYQLCDEGGRPIGRVVEPRDDRIIGRRAGTVLLVRDLPPLRPAVLPSPPNHQRR